MPENSRIEASNTAVEPLAGGEGGPVVSGKRSREARPPMTAVEAKRQRFVPAESISSAAYQLCAALYGLPKDFMQFTPPDTSSTELVRVMQSEKVEEEVQESPVSDREKLKQVTMVAAPIWRDTTMWELTEHVLRNGERQAADEKFTALMGERSTGPTNTFTEAADGESEPSKETALSVSSPSYSYQREPPMTKYRVRWWAGSICQQTGAPLFHFLCEVQCEQVVAGHHFLMPLRSSSNTTRPRHVSPPDQCIVEIPAFPGIGAPLFFICDRLR